MVCGIVVCSQGLKSFLVNIVSSSHYFAEMYLQNRNERKAQLRTALTIKQISSGTALSQGKALKR